MLNKYIANIQKHIFPLISGTSTGAVTHIRLHRLANKILFSSLWL